MANNQTPDKPFKTWEQQMNLLEQKYNLVINDKNFALTALKSLTYYDLVNGYKDSFMEDTQNEDGTVSAKFKPDISMEFLYYLCLFDKNFQATLFQYSTIIETSFKTKMAYVISKEFGVFQNDYLNPNNYHKSNNGILFSKIKSSCVDAYSNPHRLNLPTKHYVQNHNHVPAWILFKNVSFSNIINLFQLLKRNEKEQVANLLIPSTALSYDEKTKLIIDSLNMVRSFRNTIAHNLKFVS